jgi:hypothetical protein
MGYDVVVDLAVPPRRLLFFGIAEYRAADALGKAMVVQLGDGDSEAGTQLNNELPN